MPKKTLVVGASIKPSRYAYIAIKRLLDKDYEVKAIGSKQALIGVVRIETGKPHYKDINTVTLYLNPERQVEYYDYIISYRSPVNSKQTTKSGVEFSLNFGKIKALYTSFTIDGAYLNTKRVYSTVDYAHLPSSGGPKQYRNIGLYPAGESKPLYSSLESQDCFWLLLDLSGERAVRKSACRELIS